MILSTPSAQARKQQAEERGVEVHSRRRDRDHADLFLGTLKNSVKATGGELRLLVEYPGMRAMEIESLARLVEPYGDEEVLAP